MIDFIATIATTDLLYSYEVFFGANDLDDAARRAINQLGSNHEFVIAIRQADIDFDLIANAKGA